MSELWAASSNISDPHFQVPEHYCGNGMAGSRKSHTSAHALPTPFEELGCCVIVPISQSRGPSVIITLLYRRSSLPSHCSHKAPSYITSDVCHVRALVHIDRFPVNPKQRLVPQRAITAAPCLSRSTC